MKVLLPQRTKFYEEVPISTFVVKVASRCNLKCSYCYMYEHPDQTWKEQPIFLDTKMIHLFADRLSEYAHNRDIKKLIVVAHGGEPLLLGAKKLRAFFTIIQENLQKVEVNVDFGIQTNGTLVNDDIVEVLQQFDARAGVSIDGPLQWHDQMRVDKKGKGSFAQVMDGVEKLRNPSNGESVFGGFLTVANPDIPAPEIFEFFANLNTTSMDFLLPDYNFDTFPFDCYPVGTFGRWLSELFDCWLNSGTDMEIRTFRTLMKLLMGGKRGYDSFGAFSHGVIVIETDGTYHALDVLKTSDRGAQTGMSLASHPIQALEALPLVMALSAKRFSAAQKCLDCRLFDFCGGGYLPHRYSEAAGFERESLYCQDLTILIDHVSSRLAAELSAIPQINVK